MNGEEGQAAIPKKIDPELRKRMSVFAHSFLLVAIETSQSVDFIVCRLDRKSESECVSIYSGQVCRRRRKWKTICLFRMLQKK